MARMGQWGPTGWGSAANRDTSETMSDTTLRDHLSIVAQLPDFALGKLDETSLRRVSRHLEACATCRGELTNAIDVLGALAVAPPPPAWVRGAILQRAAVEYPTSTRQGGVPRSKIVEPSATGAVGRWFTSSKIGRRSMSFGQLVPRSALVAASAAVLLVSGLVAWGYEQRDGTAVIADDPISTLTDESATAYPLDDSDLPVSATGVVFADPQGREVYLVANGLPALPNDQRYQVWLFTANDQQQSAGLVTVGADGDLRAFLQTPAPFASYVGVALTAEPATGSAVPTSDLVLGGSFPPAIAGVPSAALPSLPA
jgi:anti-sigma-K factor RskA